MKILVLGACGMLANTLIRYGNSLKDFDIEFTIKDFKNQELCQEIFKKEAKYIFDALEEKNLVTILSDLKPDVCINCIGVIKQKKYDFNDIASIKINSLFPHYLNFYCQENGVRLIHLSTDCVFSGLKGLYKETDIPDPLDMYGRSKLLGEIQTSNSITIRTSIIGHELLTKYGLLEWFLNSESAVKGYINTFFSGLSTLELSKIIFNQLIPKKEISGILNVASKRINKYELLNLLNFHYKLNKKIHIDKDNILDRSLDNKKFIDFTDYLLPEWNEMISEMENFR